MTRPPARTLEEIFESQIRPRATVLKPRTVYRYRLSIRSFLAYLRTAHPKVTRLSQLRRDPHILGWLRSLYERQPRLANKSRSEGVSLVARRRS